MQKIIEFADKVALNENADIPEINKITDDNINEIKDVVNGSLQGTNAMGSIAVDNVSCKNLFSGFRAGTYDSSTGAYNPSGNGISTEKIPVQSGQTYCLSGIQVGITIRALYWNADGTYNTSEVITTTDPTTITPQGSYLAIQTSSSATYTNPQLELGTTATTYTPYKNFDNTEYVLFENTAGTSQNVSLSDNITNYKYIEVYFNATSSRGYNSVKFLSNASAIFLHTGYIGTSYKYSYNAYYTVSGSTFTVSYYDTEQIQKSNSTLTVTTDSNPIYITKVVGYK